jgi:hypothetical protein
VDEGIIELGVNLLSGLITHPEVPIREGSEVTRALSAMEGEELTGPIEDVPPDLAEDGISGLAGPEIGVVPPIAPIGEEGHSGANPGAIGTGEVGPPTHRIRDGHETLRCHPSRTNLLGLARTCCDTEDRDCTEEEEGSGE